MQLGGDLRGLRRHQVALAVLVVAEHGVCRRHAGGVGLRSGHHDVEGHGVLAHARADHQHPLRLALGEPAPRHDDRGCHRVPPQERRQSRRRVECLGDDRRDTADQRQVRRGRGDDVVQTLDVADPRVHDQRHGEVGDQPVGETGQQGTPARRGGRGGSRRSGCGPVGDDVHGGAAQVGQTGAGVAEQQPAQLAPQLRVRVDGPAQRGRRQRSRVARQVDTEDAERVQPAVAQPRQGPPGHGVRGVERVRRLLARDRRGLLEHLTPGVGGVVGRVVVADPQAGPLDREAPALPPEHGLVHVAG